MKVLLVGLGGIGKRHLESLIKLNDIEIYVFDKNPETYSHIKETKNINIIEALQDINGINFNTAIVAILNYKKAIFIEELVKNNNTDNIIIEKPICQSIYELNRLKSIGKERNLYINFPSRYYYLIKLLKNQLTHSGINISVQGNQWGLGCNLSHFLDIFLYLNNSDNNNCKITWNEFNLIDSKREGFLEIDGDLEISLNSNKLRMSHNKNFKENYLISFNFIDSNHQEIEIVVLDDKIISGNEFIPPQLNDQYSIFQSGLTQDYIIGIKNNNLLLPSIEEVYHQTLLMMNSIINADTDRDKRFLNNNINIS